MSGWQALLYKEVLRFYKVGFQTIAAPVLSSLLYLVIFSQALSGRVQVYEGVEYIAFLVPGLAMMGLLQNAFANTSSSLIQSKITGNLIFLLLTPLDYKDWFVGYVGAALVRGMLVAFSIVLASLLVTPFSMAQPLWMLCFAFLGAALMGALGLIAGLWAEKFDQLAAFQNFIIMPGTFLSGVFYSVTSLSPFWKTLSHMNPFFYLIDGFRYGFFGVSDASPWLSLSVVSFITLLVAGIAMVLLRTGYKIRS
ncbi:MAG: ABC transporter permease [Saezia sp.]